MKYIKVPLCALSEGGKKINPTTPLFKNLCRMSMYELFNSLIDKGILITNRYIWTDGKTAIYNIYPTNIEIFKPKIPIPNLLENHKNILKKIDQEDVAAYTAGYFHMIFNRIVDPMIAEMRFPSKFRKLKPTIKYIYRGLSLSEEGAKKLDAGKSVKLKPRDITSWSTNEKVSMRFAYSSTNSGVVLWLPVEEAKIVLDINSLPPCTEYWHEDEVLLKGNGIEIITNENIVYASWKNTGKNSASQISENSKLKLKQKLDYYRNIFSKVKKTFTNATFVPSINPNSSDLFMEVTYNLGVPYNEKTRPIALNFLSNLFKIVFADDKSDGLVSQKNGITYTFYKDKDNTIAFGIQTYVE